ncbi:hypothetical protein JHN55_31835, partial [Streptomyces sp. MBT56]|nr:hypothetical protein [Streptomyces sp. MBT56]
GGRCGGRGRDLGRQRVGARGALGRQIGGVGGRGGVRLLRLLPLVVRGLVVRGLLLRVRPGLRLPVRLGLLRLLCVRLRLPVTVPLPVSLALPVAVALPVTVRLALSVPLTLPLPRVPLRADRRLVLRVPGRRLPRLCAALVEGGRLLRPGVLPGRAVGPLRRRGPLRGSPRGPRR